MSTEEEGRAEALATLAAPIRPERFASPIDYLFAQHRRLRTLCQMIDQIADARARDDECVSVVLRFLREEFGRHLRDEEKGLFPLLLLRAKPEDRIDDVLKELRRECLADREDSKAIMTGLSEARSSPSFRRLLHRFAARERRHLSVGNAILLPLARVRLSASDLHQLARQLGARRGG